jgi:hypothetical protein
MRFVKFQRNLFLENKTCKKLEIREGENNWIHTFMEGSFELVSGRELIIAHFI